jgi:hypothetical protein
MLEYATSVFKELFILQVEAISMTTIEIFASVETSNLIAQYILMIMLNRSWQNKGFSAEFLLMNWNSLLFVFVYETPL